MPSSSTATHTTLLYLAQNTVEDCHAEESVGGCGTPCSACMVSQTSSEIPPVIHIPQSQKVLHPLLPSICKHACLVNEDMYTQLTWDT